MQNYDVTKRKQRKLSMVGTYLTVRKKRKNIEWRLRTNFLGLSVNKMACLVSFILPFKFGTINCSILKNFKPANI